MIGPYLTNSGKFLDASALFGITVRLAQSIGCKNTMLAEKRPTTDCHFSAPSSKPAQSTSDSPGGRSPKDHLVVDASHRSAIFHGSRETTSDIKHRRLPVT